MSKCENPYAGKGVEITGKKLCAGEKVRLTYSGILAVSGADRVFAHYGYGDSWDDSELVEMTSSGDGFQTEIELMVPGSLNVCFRDSAGNWDNNANENYTFKIPAKKSAGKTKKSVSAK